MISTSFGILAQPYSSFSMQNKLTAMWSWPAMCVAHVPTAVWAGTWVRPPWPSRPRRQVQRQPGWSTPASTEAISWPQRYTWTMTSTRLASWRCTSRPQAVRARPRPAGGTAMRCPRGPGTSSIDTLKLCS